MNSTASRSGLVGSSAAAGGVGRDRLLQVGRDAEVIDDQAARLVLVDAIDPRNRLHQPVTVHRLIDVHGVQRRRIEAGQPHIADDHQLERIAASLKRSASALRRGFVAHMRLIRLRVAWRCPS